MKKFVCTVCGYVYEGEAAPEKCPVCGVGADKFKEQTGEREWAAEHVVGVAKGVSEDILADLRANFEGECSEVLGYIIAIGFVVFGFISLFKDGREKGGGFVLFEVIGVVILACLGL